jgi:hypothetical protein
MTEHTFEPPEDGLDFTPPVEASSRRGELHITAEINWVAGLEGLAIRRAQGQALQALLDALPDTEQ